MLNTKILKNIKSALSKSKYGLTIQEMSKKLKLHRVTTTKYLYYLLGKNEVSYKVIGRAKLFMVK